MGLRFLAQTQLTQTCYLFNLHSISSQCKSTIITHLLDVDTEGQAVKLLAWGIRTQDILRAHVHTRRRGRGGSKGLYSQARSLQEELREGCSVVCFSVRAVELPRDRSCPCMAQQWPESLVLPLPEPLLLPVPCPGLSILRGRGSRLQRPRR